MELNPLHFAHPLWLWAGLAIPFVWSLYFFFYKTHSSRQRLEEFVDSHLLPYLLIGKSGKKHSFRKNLFLWTVLWAVLTLALAGPRGNLREIETFSKDQTLVILLDLSDSMNATDLKPSRLVRAKQKIEDLINLAEGVKIGLIAFAADPHMITPVTDDKETIRRLLPFLDTGLVHIQGSKLSSALNMASTMLEAEPGSNKALLIVSDGGVEDASALAQAKKLTEKGIVIHTMGVGTPQGAPIQDHVGNLIKKDGAPIISKLEKERLKAFSTIGNGRYIEADYSKHEEKLITEELGKRAETHLSVGKKHHLWDEYFYIFILLALPILLWWFRKGAIFAAIPLFFLPVNVHAETFSYFKNSEEQGKEALEKGDFEMAIDCFQDPYRKGVAYYKAGRYTEAEEMFRRSLREEVATEACYNLGNSLVLQQKLKDAVKVYEELLEKQPAHTKAKENLELVKKMLEQQKQETPDQERDNADKQGNKGEEGKEKENEKDRKETAENPSDDQKNKDKSRQENTDSTKDSEQTSPDDKQERDEAGENREDSNNHTDPKNGEDFSPEQKEPTDPSSLNQDETAAAEPLSKDQPYSVGAEEEARRDQEADLLLNRIVNDPKKFMKNKFFIESKKNKTTQGIDPW